MLIRLHVMASLWMADLRNREDGQTLVEYGLILALVSIAVIAALGFLTDGLNGIFSKVKSAL